MTGRGWVAWASNRHPQLVESVAGGLASTGRLPYLGQLDYAVPPSGGPGGNSAFRLAQVLAAFAVPASIAASLLDAAGPILLVDDLADSPWTLMAASRSLRLAGAAGVLPFVLALRS